VRDAKVGNGKEKKGGNGRALGKSFEGSTGRKRITTGRRINHTKEQRSLKEKTEKKADGKVNLAKKNLPGAAGRSTSPG